MPAANATAPASPVDDIAAQVRRLSALLLARGWQMSCAESCTGGLIAAACTEQAGSSNWFERGFVTYSNAAKVELLGIDSETLDRQGAVSEAVAQQMASGALRHARAQAAVAVTGIAGPSGGSDAKPVGTVCFGYAVGKRVLTETLHLAGDRRAVRQATVAHALTRLTELLQARAPAA